MTQKKLTLSNNDIRTSLANSNPASASVFNLRIFSWNIHWQCGSDYIKGCCAKALQKFQDLVKVTQSDIALAIELEVDSDHPFDIVFSAPFFKEGKCTQVNGTYPAPSPSPSSSGDTLALLFSPTYS